MAVSSNYTFDLDRNQIIRTAAREAGIVGPGVEPSATDVAALSDLLNVEMKALQSDGVILRTVERVSATLVAGTASISAAADTIDVDGPAFITQTGSGNVTCYPMTREEYMLLSDPTTQGCPTRFYVEKLASLTIYLYPVPDGNQTSFTYARVRLLRDMDTGAVTEDLPSRWLKAVIYALAHAAALAYQKPMERVQYLAMLYEAEKGKALGQDGERGDAWFHVGRS